MLLPRVLSAIFMAVLFVFAVFILEEKSFSFAMACVVLLAGWEWARLSGVTCQSRRVFFAFLVVCVCFLVLSFDFHEVLLYLSPFLWITALYWVVQYPSINYWYRTFTRLFFGLLVLVTTWSALVYLRQGEEFVLWVLFLMSLIWGADSGAYFAGRVFGKRKLAKYVSPGKTWEGVAGGIFLTQLFSIIFSFFNHFTISQWVALALVSFLTALVSVLGDLTESLFKRHESLKDSSRLIPGHGGVMDRVDSLTAAAPIYVLALSLVGWI